VTFLAPGTWHGPASHRRLLISSCHRRLLISSWTWAAPGPAGCALSWCRPQPAARDQRPGTGAGVAPGITPPPERATRTAREKVDGLPAGFRYHDLRHHFASLLIASGADVKTVQARLRHATAKTTLDTYGQIWPGRDESTRAAVDDVIAGRAEQRRNNDNATAQRRRSR
jgi:integrase